MTQYCKVKRIFVKPGQRLSYQFTTNDKKHDIVSGVARITLDDVTEDYNDRTKQEWQTQDSEDMILRSSNTGEDDIVRVQDDYDRPEKHESE